MELELPPRPRRELAYSAAAEFRSVTFEEVAQIVAKPLRRRVTEIAVLMLWAPFLCCSALRSVSRGNEKAAAASNCSPRMHLRRRGSQLYADEAVPSGY